MGVDQPEESDVPPEGHVDRRDDQTGAGGRSGRSGGDPPETRPRQEYDAELRVKDSLEQKVTAQQAAARDQAAAEKWGETKTESRWMWLEYQRKWPPEERPPVDRSLKPADNERVKAECDRVAQREREIITPVLRATESEDPDRRLVGLEKRLKDSDRLKEKINKTIKDFNRSPEQAVSLVPDAIRYTFQYPEARYTPGVLADVARLKEHGLELHKLKNSWSSDQYKGINSQWSEQATGQRFEVQFHTRISFEAKQLTHSAYERLRAQPKPDKFEQMVLEAFQNKVTNEVPVPPGADGIPDYPKRGIDAR